MFFDNYDKLCKGAGKSANSVAKELGVSSGTVTGWKQGAAPKADTLVAIAEYFGVSTDYLLGIGDLKSKPTVETDDELTSEELEYLKIFRAASPEKRRAMLLLFGEDK